MNKFEQTLEELKNILPLIPEITAVFLYGSVARGDYSLRHSDMDLFIIVNSKDVSEKIKGKIGSILLPIGSKYGVTLHLEFQGADIKEEDKTLLEKMMEEGSVIYAMGMLVFPAKKLGLRQYIIYEYSSDKPAVRTRISQILHGRKSWYFTHKKKVVKTYAGIADDKDIIPLGAGELMVVREKQTDVISSFDRLGVSYRQKRIVYG